MLLCPHCSCSRCIFHTHSVRVMMLHFVLTCTVSRHSDKLCTEVLQGLGVEISPEVKEHRVWRGFVSAVPAVCIKTLLVLNMKSTFQKTQNSTVEREEKKERVPLVLPSSRLPRRPPSFCSSAILNHIVQAPPFPV